MRHPRHPRLIMNCTQCEERISDYVENALTTADRSAIDLHLESCGACSELLAGVSEVLVWGKTFPVYESPAWLAPRIIVWKWVIEPRTAMAVFTATLVLGWLGGLAGLSPNWVTVVRDPAAIYYGAQSALNRAYNEAVRTYYSSAVVAEIQIRIEQLREIS